MFFVFFQEELENTSFFLAKTDFHTQLRLLKCLANILVLLKYHLVEHFCKVDDREILHLLRVLNANDMSGTCLLKDSSNKFRVACRDEHEIKLKLVLIDHSFETLATDQLTGAIGILKHEKIALVLVSLVELATKVFIVKDAMATKMKAHWSLGKDFL